MCSYMKTTMAYKIVFLLGVLCFCVTSTWAVAGQFKYEIRNQLKAPEFQYNTELVINDPSDPLFVYMKKAVDTDPNFTRFTVTYYKQWGYFVDAINDVYSTYSHDKSYWRFLDGNTGQDLNVGVSTYRPKVGDYIIANLTNEPYQ